MATSFGNKRVGWAIALVLAVATGPVPAAAAPSTAAWAQTASLDPTSVYGETLVFRVLRNGDPVGFHRVGFDRHGEDLIVRSRFEVDVRMMFVSVYRYTYTATERWRAGRLVLLSASADDDGTKSRVEAEVNRMTLHLSEPKGSSTAAAGIFPTSHWHPGVLASTRVLNTITGRVNDVRITDKGTDEILVNGERKTARRYVYSGDIANEVWYDAEGRWVGMRFSGKDGSTIEYVCESCRDSIADRS